MGLVPEDADWMIGEIEAEKQQDTNSRQDYLASLRSQIETTDEKLERLMQAYLDKTLSLEEYRLTKNQLIQTKQELKDKLTALTNNHSSWFEPAIRFLKASKQAVFLAERGSDEEQRDFLKKHGSNLKIENRHLSVVPREPWKRVVDQGSFAQPKTPAPLGGAGVVGETHHALHKAERGRFELPRAFRPDRFSKPAHSTALPPLQG